MSSVPWGVKSGRPDAALPLFARGCRARTRGGRHDHAAQLKERAALGPNLLGQKWAQAEKALRDSLTAREKQKPSA